MYIFNLRLGSGWLTVNVIAAVPEFWNRSWNPYVKLIVHYQGYVKCYTTNVIEKSTGWTPIGETFRLPKVPKNTPIQLQIWHFNKYNYNQQLYEEITTLSSMIDRIVFENSTIRTNSKLFMVSIWRDDIEDEYFPSF